MSVFWRRYAFRPCPGCGKKVREDEPTVAEIVADEEFAIVLWHPACLIKDQERRRTEDEPPDTPDPPLSAA